MRVGGVPPALAAAEWRCLVEDQLQLHHHGPMAELRRAGLAAGRELCGLAAQAQTQRRGFVLSQRPLVADRRRGTKGSQSLAAGGASVCAVAIVAEHDRPYDLTPRPPVGLVVPVAHKTLAGSN